MTRNPIKWWKAFLTAHPRLEKTLTTAQTIKTVRSRLAKAASFAAQHAGLILPAAMVAALGVAAPAAYQSGRHTGEARCNNEHVTVQP